jgi:hypothetical protein
MVRVSPTDVTVRVTVPLVAGATVVVKVPVESVVPVDAPSVTVPVPACVTVTVCPGRTAAETLLTVTVRVAALPPTMSDEADEASVTVDPLMRIGICVDLPLAVAVMVAVRVVGFDEPEEKVTVALPVESLTTEPVDRKPVSAENVTVTPATAAFDVSTTVAVIVEVVLLSAATVVGLAPRLIAAAVATGVVVTGVVVVELPDPPPPQAPSSANSAIRKKDEIARDEFIFNLCSCYRGDDERCRS